MKKLVFLFVAFAAISLASCKGNQTPAEGTNDSDSVAQVSDSDSLAADSNATVSTDSLATATDSVK